MRSVALLQARMSSRRLPGKVLMPIDGRAMLLRQIDRVRRATLIDELVVATSVDRSDDPIERACREEGIDVFRGSLHDVLDRFHSAALAARADHVVRLTGDCPLSDPQIIDRVIRHHRENECDYTSNFVPPTFPDGLDCEVMTMGALASAWRQAIAPDDREHVTPFLYHHPAAYRVGHISHDIDLSAWRWTVDEPEDFAVVEAVFKRLLPVKPAFVMDDICRLARDCPEIFAENLRFQRAASPLTQVAP